MKLPVLALGGVIFILAGILLVSGLVKMDTLPPDTVVYILPGNSVNGLIGSTSPAYGQYTYSWPANSQILKITATALPSANVYYSYATHNGVVHTENPVQVQLTPGVPALIYVFWQEGASASSKYIITVKDLTTYVPIQGATVRLYYTNGQASTYGLTDAQGKITITALYPDAMAYFVASKTNYVSKKITPITGVQSYNAMLEPLVQPPSWITYTVTVKNSLNNSAIVGAVVYVEASNSSGYMVPYQMTTGSAGTASFNIGTNLTPNYLSVTAVGYTGYGLHATMAQNTTITLAPASVQPPVNPPPGNATTTITFSFLVQSSNTSAPIVGATVSISTNVTRTNTTSSAGTAELKIPIAETISGWSTSATGYLSKGGSAAPSLSTTVLLDPETQPVNTTTSFTLTLIVKGYGQVDLLPGAHEYDAGTTVTITVLWGTFDHWTLDGNTFSTMPMEALMNADHAVEVTFKAYEPPTGGTTMQTGTMTYIMGMGFMGIGTVMVYTGLKKRKQE